MSGEGQNVIELTKQDWAQLVTNEIGRLGLTPEEYLSSKDQGNIDPCNPHEVDIRMLMQIGGETAKQDLVELAQDGTI